MKRVIESEMVGNTAVRLIEETLTDGSHVYNVELGIHDPRVVCETACADSILALELFRRLTGPGVTSLEISEDC